MGSAPKEIERLGNFDDRKSPVYDRVERVSGKERVHGIEVFDRTNGDPNDIGVLGLKPCEVDDRLLPVALTERPLCLNEYASVACFRLN